jgi:hypothetical protein
VIIGVESGSPSNCSAGRAGQRQTAGRNRPTDAEVVECGQQLSRTRQGTDLMDDLAVMASVTLLQRRDLLGRDLPVDLAASARTKSPPLIPIRRWIRHTARSIPSSASAPRQAMTCWYTLSISVPSRSKMNDGLLTQISLSESAHASTWNRRAGRHGHRSCRDLLVAGSRLRRRWISRFRETTSRSSFHPRRRERGWPSSKQKHNPRNTRTFTSTSFVDDAAEQASEVERLVALGATRVDWDSYPVDPDFIVLADTEGNRFCIVDASHG